jgi:single stranded DNA-binding protein
MAELKVYGVGIPTADPELKHIGENNTPVCNVNLAFNRSFRKNDDWVKETTFMRSQTFGKRGTKMSEIVKKGCPVYVEGHITQNNWKSENGEPRMALVLTIRDFQVCQKFNKNNGNNNNNNNNNDNPENVPVNASSSDNDGIPF